MLCHQHKNLDKLLNYREKTIQKFFSDYISKVNWCDYTNSLVFDLEHATVTSNF